MPAPVIPKMNHCDDANLFLESVRQGDIATARNVGKRDGVNVNQRWKQWGGRTALLVAIDNANNAMTKFLLNEMECDPAIADRNGRNAMHHAVLAGNLEVVKMLIAHGRIDYSVSDANQETPLHMAAKQRNLEITKAILLQNPDIVNDKQMNGYTPYDLACRTWENRPTAKLLDPTKPTAGVALENGDAAPPPITTAEDAPVQRTTWIPWQSKTKSVRYSVVKPAPPPSMPPAQMADQGSEVGAKLTNPGAKTIGDRSLTKQAPLRDQMPDTPVARSSRKMMTPLSARLAERRRNASQAPGPAANQSTNDMGLSGRSKNRTPSPPTNGSASPTMPRINMNGGNNSNSSSRVEPTSLNALVDEFVKSCEKIDTNLQDGVAKIIASVFGDAVEESSPDGDPSANDINDLTRELSEIQDIEDLLNISDALLKEDGAVKEVAQKVANLVSSMKGAKYPKCLRRCQETLLSAARALRQESEDDLMSQLRQDMVKADEASLKHMDLRTRYDCFERSEHFEGMESIEETLDYACCDAIDAGFAVLKTCHSRLPTKDTEWQIAQWRTTAARAATSAVDTLHDTNTRISRYINGIDLKVKQLERKAASHQEKPNGNGRNGHTAAETNYTPQGPATDDIGRFLKNETERRRKFNAVIFRTVTGPVMTSQSDRHADQLITEYQKKRGRLQDLLTMYSASKEMTQKIVDTASEVMDIAESLMKNQKTMVETVRCDAIKKFVDVHKKYTQRLKASIARSNAKLRDIDDEIELHTTASDRAARSGRIRDSRVERVADLHVERNNVVTRTRRYQDDLDVILQETAIADDKFQIEMHAGE
ncbi:Ankyrin repeat domain-containing protein [Plasmodiophora brassicae]|uniref:Uncharacterized protein n=1 Tax=Plasmodiophora brassicae TaxID=37360 RepID=A0A0G4IZ84_PLABS|nr:hypothetical protein PBRA_001687 [Plasmodiophora brassicae]